MKWQWQPAVASALPRPHPCSCECHRGTETSRIPGTQRYLETQHWLLLLFQTVLDATREIVFSARGLCLESLQKQGEARDMGPKEQKGGKREKEETMSARTQGQEATVTGMESRLCDWSTE